MLHGHPYMNSLSIYAFFFVRMFDSAKALAFKNLPTREEVSLLFIFVLKNCISEDYCRNIIVHMNVILKLYMEVLFSTTVQLTSPAGTIILFTSTCGDSVHIVSHL